MRRQKPFHWIVMAMGIIFWMTTPISQALSAEAKTLGEAYPEFSEGVLKSAKMEKMDENVLLKAHGFEIKASFAEELFGKVEPKVKKELEKSMLFLLDQEATEKLLIRDAKSMGIATEHPDEQMFQAYINRITQGVTVSEKAVRTFYDDNREMVGGMPFDQVKDSIQGVLLQKKKQEALQDHIQKIAEKAQMRVNEDWVKKQVAMAGDNPLDRARLSGRPTMVQFSANGCGPCEMMKPIVKKLKKKYEGTINIVYIPVTENQMLAKRFNVTAVPVQVFFDKAGKKVHHHMGFMAEADILNQFKKMGAI
jgi:thioredoxin 1